MIVVTGASGFIGSAIVYKLNKDGIDNIICVDKLGKGEKWKNLRKRNFYDFIDRDVFLDWVENYKKHIKVIVHMGACSDTTEKDGDFLLENNYRYTQKLFEWCVVNNKRLIYASSAATYGNGNLGFDDMGDVTQLIPLNKYGYSKHLFDLWYLKQKTAPKQCVGLKFFNVYGPNEYHKGVMASVVYHAFNQINTDGKIRLFKSYKNEYSHGEQARDFIYIKDVIKVIKFFIDNDNISGIFNVGTGKARTFNDLAKATFNALNKQTNIEYIDMPDELKNKYQYFTEAKINKLRKVGYKENFYTLEEGVKDYVQNYLISEDKYL